MVFGIVTEHLVPLPMATYDTPFKDGDALSNISLAYYKMKQDVAKTFKKRLLQALVSLCFLLNIEESLCSYHKKGFTL